ncbi:MAG: hypothetical protein Q9220_005428 [cf. Caloplaca sp. 1 TL-2023]
MLSQLFSTSSGAGAVSPFDKLPNEVVREILNYAMISDTPFNISDCIRTAKALENTMKEKRVPCKDPAASNEVVEDDRYFEMSSTAFCSKELSSTYFKEMDERRNKKTSIANAMHKWPLYEASIEVQQRHLLDWRLAGSVCKRFRTFGKEAFFSNKAFALEPTLLQNLQELKVNRMSIEDQQTAVSYINTLILVVYNLQSPGAFMRLGHRVVAFPSLGRLDFFLGGRQGEPLAWMVKAAKERMDPPPHFINILETIGVPVERLAIGILVNPDSKWGYQESLLLSNVYPMLRAWTARKAAKETK